MSDCDMTEEAPSSSANDQRAAGSDDVVERDVTVFVGNVPLDATKKDIKKFFRGCGRIVSVRFRGAVSGGEKHLPQKAAVIKRKFAATAQCLSAFVRFATRDEAQNALSRNGVTLKKRHIRVDACTPNNYDVTKTLYLGNVPYDASEDELRDVFMECGLATPTLVRIVRDRSTGLGKGFAFVVFEDAAMVGLALKLAGVELRGRPLRITKCAKKKKMPSRSSQSDGQPQKRLSKKVRKLIRKRKKQKGAKTC